MQTCPGGQRAKLLTTNRNVLGSHLTGDLCCVPFAIFISLHFFFYHYWKLYNRHTMAIKQTKTIMM